MAWYLYQDHENAGHVLSLVLLGQLLDRQLDREMHRHNFPGEYLPGSRVPWLSKCGIAQDKQTFDVDQAHRFVPDTNSGLYSRKSYRGGFSSPEPEPTSLWASARDRP